MCLRLAQCSCIFKVLDQDQCFPAIKQRMSSKKSNKIFIIYILEKNESSNFSDDRDMKLNELSITYDQVIGLSLDLHYGNRAESPTTVS